MLSKLPPELIVIILLELDWRSILKTQQTCRIFHEIVTSHTYVQYFIELGIAGMVDGPADSPRAVNKRFSRLKLYQERWRKLSYISSHSVSVPKGFVWELASGVLAQGLSVVNEQTGRKFVSKLFFSKLPSDARRESKRKEWTFDGYEFPVRDFTMDPSQDLLVLMRVVSSQELDPHEIDDGGTRIIAQLHLRSLSTNSKHPDAKLGVLAYPITLPAPTQSSHILSICQDKICLLHRTTMLTEQIDQLVVWNWKEAEKKFSLKEGYIFSFSFLTNNHLLLAVNSYNALPFHEGDQQTRLLICDIERTSNIDSSLYPNAYVAIAELHLPPLDRHAEVVDVLIRSDPPPHSFSHAYNEELSSSQQIVDRRDVPFTVGPLSRLFVITLAVANSFGSGVGLNAWQRKALAIFVPLSTFLPYLRQTREPTMIWTDASTEDENRHSSLPKREIAVEWEEWIPNGTRMLVLPERESVWVCNVFGMKYVYGLEPRELGNRSGRHVAVLDFNAANVQRFAELHAKEEETNISVGNKTLTQRSEYVTQSSTLEANRYYIFSCDVTTRVPYSFASTSSAFKFDAVMVTEDNIVLVNRAGRKEYRILTF